MRQPSLFEDADAWRRAPEAAFDALLSTLWTHRRPIRASTARIYRGQFARLLLWLRARHIDLLDLKPEHLEAFFDERQLGEGTRHRYLLVFTMLGSHMRKLRLLDGNPARDLLTARPAPEPMPPVALDPESAWRVLEAAGSVGPGGWKRQRLTTMIAVLLAAGLRTSEILALRLDQVQWDFGLVRVPATPPRPAREVPLRPLALAALTRWGRVRREAGLHGQIVFPGTPQGAILSPSSLFRQVRACLELAGVSSRYEGPMLLRNTCAAWWLAESEVPAVSAAMGYAHDDTSERFLEASRLWAGLPTTGVESLERAYRER